MLGSSILTRRKGPAPLPTAYARRPSEAVAARSTQTTLHGISAYRRGSRLIARTIGMLPIVLERNGIVTDEVLPLLEQPIPWMSRQAAVESMVMSLIDYGNYVALWSQFDNLGRPQGIIPVDPLNAYVALTDMGVVWRIANQFYGSADVLHIRTGGPAESLLGWGVLQTSANAINTAVSVASASQYFYADGVYPSGILKSDDPEMNDEKAEEIRDKWVSKVRRNRPAVLPASLEFQPVVAPNAEQAQLAQANHMSRQQIADLLDLDGDWLGVPAQSLTYANIVDRADHLIRFTCQPWMSAIEEGLTAGTSRPTRAKLDTSALLRGQVADRYAAYAVGLDKKFLVVDEVREWEGLEPLPEPEPQPIPPQLPQPPGDPNAQDPNAQEGQQP